MVFLSSNACLNSWEKILSAGLISVSALSAQQANAEWSSLQSLAAQYRAPATALDKGVPPGPVSYPSVGTTPTTTTPTTTTPAPTPTSSACSTLSGDALSITAYGATGGDTSDDTAAINSTISAAKVLGKKVYVPAGTYYHKNVTLDAVSLIGESKNTAILYAFDAANNTLFVKGDGVTVSNVQKKSVSTSRTGVDHSFFINGATNFTIDNVIVDGGNSGGIFNYGGSNGRIINSLIKNTLADSIHNTRGAHDTIVANNTVRNSGDDMIAVVGYSGDGQPYNILIQENDLADQMNGRGISVVGGKDVTIQNNKVARTHVAAGILVASEPAYNTYGVSNVLIRNNQLIENSGSTRHGAFLISGFHGKIDRVRFEANTITNPVHDSIKLEGLNSNTAIINNTMTDPERRGINIVAGSNVFCAGNTLNGGASFSTRCTGANSFTVTGAPLTYTATSTCPAL